MTNDAAPARHLLRILDHTGHAEIAYDPADDLAVRDVGERFDRLMKQNFVAFDLTTTPGRMIRTFDPAATEIVVTQQFAGG